MAFLQIGPFTFYKSTCDKKKLYILEKYLLEILFGPWIFKICIYRTKIILLENYL